MPKKKVKNKGKISLQFLIFSLLVVALVSLPRPAYQPTDGSQIIQVAYAQEKDRDNGSTKKAARAEYKKLVKKIKSEYRTAREIARGLFMDELKSAEEKSDRIEARKKYLQTIKDSKQKQDNALRDAKNLFHRTGNI